MKRTVAAAALALGIAFTPLAPASAAPATIPTHSQQKEGREGGWFDRFTDRFEEWFAEWFEENYGDRLNEPAPTVTVTAPAPTESAVPTPSASATPTQSATPVPVDTPSATPSATPSPTTTPAPVTPAPTPSTTTPPATGNTSGGTGGTAVNREFVSFTSAGLTSTYHVYAEGLDLSKPVGLLMWADGSGGYGFDNPSQSYLIGGANGMRAIAKARNMVLVVPNAPAPGCDGTDNCWYDRDSSVALNKAKWSSDLMTNVKSRYNINLDRVAVGGYSSGAQWTTNFFVPAFGEAQSVDLFMPFAYGGPPRTDTKWSAAFKSSAVGVWNTGTRDPAIGNARNGFDAYKRAGFATLEFEPSNSTHSRGGEFGAFAAQNIDQYLR